ncbi:MAG: anaerobic ribonucleoside-triphosphate reductase activating protein [Clostridiales bacterium]|nr:anaerobic ribonucleoside-triphosphate reductase activating protein [Clostridiales bacterium]
MNIRISGTANDSIVDGPGLRFTIFTQGCPHDCKGCHNPQTHNFNGGEETTTEKLIAKFKANPLLDGITLSGGEPFCQGKPLVEIAREAKSFGLDVIIYTGFKIEYLLENSNEENCYNELIQLSDYIVDGKFELEKRSLSIHFKGSSNQRIIDVKKTLDSGTVVEINW